MRSDLAAKIPDGSMPNTFAANSLSAAVALTNISILQDPELDLLNRAHTLGLEAQAHIRGFNSPLVGEVRGRGLMLGIELARPCGVLALRALEAGLLINVTRDRV
ncbi:aminotransferase class III-fold pyridoxal phosphate-dependent enzyme, partial [Paraburkholderia sp. SIMBA_009]